MVRQGHPPQQDIPQGDRHPPGGHLYGRDRCGGVPLCLAGTRMEMGIPYLSHYQDGSIVETLLPEKLPEQTEQYEIRMVPAMLQGAGGIDICYYTDTATVKTYQQKAQSICQMSYMFTPDVQEQYEAASLDLSGKTAMPDGGTWFSYMDEKGASQADTQGAEVYVLGKGSQNRAVWMLNPKTGYFRIYW